MLGDLARGAGDLLDRTGLEAGAVIKSKKGDFVLTVDARVARGCDLRVVIEAKDRPMSMRAMREELREARENRGAAVALAVFTPAHAPTGVAPFTLVGDDVYCVIDPTRRSRRRWRRPSGSPACWPSPRSPSARSRSTPAAIGRGADRDPRAARAGPAAQVAADLHLERHEGGLDRSRHDALQHPGPRDRGRGRDPRRTGLAALTDGRPVWPGMGRYGDGTRTKGRLARRLPAGGDLSSERPRSVDSAPPCPSDPECSCAVGSLASLLAALVLIPAVPAAAAEPATDRAPSPAASRRPTDPTPTTGPDRRAHRRPRPREPSPDAVADRRRPGRRPRAHGQPADPTEPVADPGRPPPQPSRPAASTRPAATSSSSSRTRHARRRRPASGAATASTPTGPSRRPFRGFTAKLDARSSRRARSPTRTSSPSCPTSSSSSPRRRPRPASPRIGAKTRPWPRSTASTSASTPTSPSSTPASPSTPTSTSPVATTARPRTARPGRDNEGHGTHVAGTVAALDNDHRRRRRRARGPHLGRQDPQRRRLRPAVVVRLRPRLDPRPARPERLAAGR